MSYRGQWLSGAAALGFVVVGCASAQAGGFAIREQSAYGLGSAYAGMAAGGSLSSMFWNPATITQMPGIQSESVLTGILPYASNTPTAGSSLTALGYGGTGNVGIDALVPASYNSWQLTPDLWLGFSLTSPFGLSEHFPDSFAGRDYAEDASVRTYNAAPTVAYRLTNWLSVGAGVQIQYMTVNLLQGIGPIPPPLPATDSNLSGGGWGYGYTLGATLTPTPTTTIGIGYRSAIDQKINGTLITYIPLGANTGSVNTTLDLPGTLSIGLKQKLGPQWTLMAGLEWTNWSRIGTANILQPNGAPANVLGHPAAVHFEYRDGWYGSVGAEYRYNERLAVRTGIGFERSPISDAVRIPLLPDNDRIWLALGASYQLTPKLGLDFAYSHVFVKDTSVAVGPGNPSYVAPSPQYYGTVDSHLDIVSVALKYRWDNPVVPEKKLLITK